MDGLILEMGSKGLKGIDFQEQNVRRTREVNQFHFVFSKEINRFSLIFLLFTTVLLSEILETI